MNLPTISIPDELAPRVMAVFNNDADIYRTWLRRAIRDKVVEVEQEALLQQQYEAKRALTIQQQQERQEFADSVSADFGVTP